MGIRQILEDDLTGAPLPDETKPQTVTFEGTKYQVYLSASSSERFAAFLSGQEPLLSSYKSSATPRKSSGAGKGSDSTNRYGYTAADVRAWADETGHKVDGKGLAAQGRVSQAWFDAIKDDRGEKS